MGFKSVKNTTISVGSDAVVLRENEASSRVLIGGEVDLSSEKVIASLYQFEASKDPSPYAIIL
jgi:hypothetical protein